MDVARAVNLTWCIKSNLNVYILSTCDKSVLKCVWCSNTIYISPIQNNICLRHRKIITHCDVVLFQTVRISYIDWVHCIMEIRARLSDRWFELLWTCTCSLSFSNLCDPTVPFTNYAQSVWNSCGPEHFVFKIIVFEN